jgi:hypothetical protein
MRLSLESMDLNEALVTLLMHASETISTGHCPALLGSRLSLKGLYEALVAE